MDKKIPKPIRRDVLVQQDEAIKMTESGIVLLTSGNTNKRPNRGTVVAVSDRVELVKVGDRVAFSMYAGVVVRHEDGEYLLMSENETLCTIGDEDVNIGTTRDTENMHETISRFLPQE